MISETSRRRFIGTAGIVASGAMVPALALAPSAQPTVSPKLRRAIDLHDRLEAECERFDVEVEMPARQACRAEIDALPVEAPPPHVEAKTTFVNLFGERVRLSTESVGLHGVARKVASDPTWADMGDAEWRSAHLEVAAAADERDAILAAQAARRKVAEDAIIARYRIKAIASRSDALVTRRLSVWSLIVGMPAASLADVAAKLDLIERTMDDEPDSVAFDAIAADVRRLLAQQTVAGRA